MQIVKILARLRELKVDPMPAHCVLAISELGGSANRPQLLEALGYAKAPSINLQRLISQGWLRSEGAYNPAMEGIPLKGIQPFVTYALGVKGIELLEQLKDLLEEEKEEE